MEKSFCLNSYFDVAYKSERKCYHTVMFKEQFCYISIRLPGIQQTIIEDIFDRMDEQINEWLNDAGEESTLNGTISIGRGIQVPLSWALRLSLWDHPSQLQHSPLSQSQMFLLLLPAAPPTLAALGSAALGEIELPGY